MKDENFTILGIGAQKCGTTYVHSLLSHAFNYQSLVKEFNFFSGPDYAKGYHWYTKRSCVNSLIIDFSPSYFCSTDALERIVDYSKSRGGNVVLVVCLRNPLDRIISNIKHELMRGRLAPDELHLWKNNKWIIENSLYLKHLRRWSSSGLPIYILKSDSCHINRQVKNLVDEIIVQHKVETKDILEFVPNWDRNESSMNLKSVRYRRIRELRKAIGVFGFPKVKVSKWAAGRSITSWLRGGYIEFPDLTCISDEAKLIMSHELDFYDYLNVGWFDAKDIL